MSTEAESKILEALFGIKEEVAGLKVELKSDISDLNTKVSVLETEVAGVKKVQDILLERQLYDKAEIKEIIREDKKEIKEMRKEDKKEILERIDKFETNTSRDFSIQRNMLEIERNRVDKIYDSRDKVQMKFSKALVAGNGAFAGLVAFLVSAFK